MSNLQTFTDTTKSATEKINTRRNRETIQSLLLSLGTIVLLGSMMLAVVVVSIFFFFPSSLRLDEAQSLYQTNRTFGGMLQFVAQDVHVPLYHSLLHFWQIFFGNTIESARSLSLVFFVLTIPATYILAQYAFKKRGVSLFAAFLVAASPFMIWYGSEARMYAQLAFFTVIHQLYFLKIFREAKPDHWLLYTLTAVLGVYTHYFFFFVLLAEIVFFAFNYKQFAAKKALRKFILSAAVVVAAFVPWVIYFVQQGIASNTQPRLSPPSSVDLFNTYTQFIFGFQSDTLNTIIVSMWPLLVLLAFFALQKNRRDNNNEVIFFVMAAAIPVLAAFFISILVRPFYLSRYLIASLPALFIFISWLITTYPKKIANTFRGVLAVAVIAGLIVQVLNPLAPVKEDYASVSSYLAENTSSSDVVAISAPFTIYPIEYYYQGDAPLTTIPAWNRFEAGSLPVYEEDRLAEYVEQANGEYQTVWLVLSFDQGYQEPIREYYANRYEKLSEKRFSEDLTVYQYKLRYDDEVSLNP